MQVMAIDSSELDQMQRKYKAAVDEWVAAIRREEALASVNHDVAEVDQWENAADREEELRGKAKAAKTAYESALRREFFNF
jgi:nicotinamide mononucleotide adenylyltransferase